jgi:hypothetical protein
MQSRSLHTDEESLFHLHCIIFSSVNQRSHAAEKFVLSSIFYIVAAELFEKSCITTILKSVMGLFSSNRCQPA